MVDESISSVYADVRLIRNPRGHYQYIAKTRPRAHVLFCRLVKFPPEVHQLPDDPLFMKRRVLRKPGQVWWGL